MKALVQTTLTILTLLGLAAAQAQTTNLIMNDVFADGIRTNTPIDVSNSFWQTQEGNGANFSGLAATPSPNFLVASNVSTSSRFYMCYFTTNSAEPNLSENTNAVDLAVGQTIRATLVFTPTNIPATHANSQYGLRFGLFDLADGGGRTNRDNNAYNTSSATIAGTNVLGYLIEVNFLTTFNSDTPIQFFARTNTDSMGNNLLSTASTNISKLGSGPAGYNSLPGFVSGTTYTLELSVARHASSNVFKAKIAGGSLNLEQEFIDTAATVHRFDSFGIRSNRKEDTCDFMTLSQFKVETLSGGGTPSLPFPITSVQLLSPDAFKLTWNSISSRVYQVQSRTNLTAGIWTTNATVTALGSATSYTNSGVLGSSLRFFRVAELP